MSESWIELRRRTFTSCLLGWASLGTLVWLASTRLDIPPSAGLQAAGLFLVINAWLWLALPHHLPQPRFGWANGVTLMRATGVALLAGLIGLEGDDTLAWLELLLALTMLLLDGIDGWLARRFNSASLFGARFDMEVDALFILVLALLVWQFDKAPGWILLAGLWRYGFIVVGQLYPKLAAPLPPSKRRQTGCVVQIVALLICLNPWLPNTVTAPLALIALLFLSTSFIIDIHYLVTRIENPAAD